MAESGNKDLIITPTYNEKENIDRFMEKALEAFPDADMLVIDDSSPDGTARIVEERSKRDGRIHLKVRPGKLGLGSAYIDGFGWALEHGYERVYEMDADFSHDPKYLSTIRDELVKGSDLVIGSRRVKGGGVEGWGPVRHAISGGGSIYSRLVLGIPVKDLTAGFKGIRRKVLETLEWDRFYSRGFFFQVETHYRAWKAGFRIKEVPILFKDRTAGKSKMNRKIFFEALLLALKLRIKG
ncbi:MAG: polyprenol monophosphomannose synthase [Pseudomonadota bacterium]